MDEDEGNVYRSPDAEDVDDGRQGDRPSLEDYSWPELKKLYYRSCNVGAIGVLLLLGSIIIAGILISFSSIPREEIEEELVLAPFLLALFLGIVLFDFIGFVGAIWRPSWGRPVGIAACILMILTLHLLNIIIGIVGLVAFINASELFGRNRLTHREIKRAFEARKRAAKTRKRAARDERRGAGADFF